MKFKARNVAICVGLFLFLLILQFPTRNFRGQVFEKIYRASRVQVSADDLGISLFGWPGLTLSNVDVSYAPMGINIAAKSAVFRVGLGRVWPPSPSYSGSIGDLQGGGDLWFRFVEGGGRIDVGIDGEAINAQLLSLYNFPPPVSGFLDIVGDLGITPQSLNQSTGKLEIKGKSIKLSPQNFQQFFRLPSTNIGNIAAKITINNGVAEINEFQLGDTKSDIQGKLTGNIKLGQVPEQSLLNLTLRVQLSQAFADNPASRDIKGFLSGYQVATNSYAMRWAATIGDMQVNMFSAIPQKVN